MIRCIFERQFHNGEYTELSSITFKDTIIGLVRALPITRRKRSSHRARRIALNHIMNEFGQTLIQKITKKAYQDTIDELSNRFSTNYVSSMHTSANMVFNYAHENKLIKEVPTKDIKLPKKKKTVADLEKGDSINEKFLEKEELEEFLTVAKNEGLEGDLLTFALLAYTGLRIGEMIALKWADIDFTNTTLRVYKTYYNPTNNKLEYQLLTPKTESSVRTISIDTVLIDLLELHKLKQEQTMKDNGSLYNDNDFIFATNQGYPKTIKHIAIRMQRLLKRTSIKKNVTPHSFRHTHTSLLIEANVHIKKIQERLGHSDINTTMDIYAHMTKNVKKEASTRFSNLMKDLSDNLIQ